MSDLAFALRQLFLGVGTVLNFPYSFLFHSADIILANTRLSCGFP